VSTIRHEGSDAPVVSTIPVDVFYLNSLAIDVVVIKKTYLGFVVVDNLFVSLWCVGSQQVHSRRLVGFHVVYRFFGGSTEDSYVVSFFRSSATLLKFACDNFILYVSVIVIFT
jgi:hypothetical protein